MSGAADLIDRIRKELTPLEAKIIRHRYLAAVENGRVSHESLAVFAIQQHHIITSDLRSIAQSLARHGNLSSRAYLLNVLEGENSALEELGKFAKALGITSDTISGSEPLPAAFAYSTFLTWLAMYGSDAELAGALSLNFAAWGTNCATMSSGLKAKYGLQPDAVSFFDLFANLPPAGDAAIKVIEGGLDRGVSGQAITRAARMLQSYELMYWDAMAESADATP
jgi:pyrroloquinoline quinone (PQQ) biosynthesis protein C